MTGMTARQSSPIAVPIQLTVGTAEAILGAITYPFCRSNLVPLNSFQGLEDKIVPHEQAETMVNALRRNRIPFAYVAYEGEQQGFRRAENIKRTAELEFWFYGQALGFMPADRIVPIDLEIPLEAA